MCHDALEVTLNPNVNFIIGRNGSGKSAILTALTVGLGAKANVTNRGASVKSINILHRMTFFVGFPFFYMTFLCLDFIKKGKNSATIEISLFNKGSMAYKPDVYGDSITVLRSIGTTSSYKLKNWRGNITAFTLYKLLLFMKALFIVSLIFTCI